MRDGAKRLFSGMLGLVLGLGLVAGAGAQTTLWSNGSIITATGSGPGGTDISLLQDTSLGLASFGFDHDAGDQNRVADDFVVGGLGWTVTAFEFLAYQQGSGTVSSLSAVNLRIWDGPPAEPGSLVVAGDVVTNLLTSTTFAGTYRQAESGAPDDVQRPIMRNRVELSPAVPLPPGTYWVDWQTEGNAVLSGPWVPPLTILGSSSTGNARLSLDQGSTWAPALDTGNDAAQGLPFEVQGFPVRQNAQDVPIGPAALGLLVLLLALVGLWRLR